jgi:hypothetical protein
MRRNLSQMLAVAFVALSTSACAASLELTELKKTSSPPSNVAIYFKVTTTKGDPVPNLQAESFEILEDEKLVSTLESKQTILNPEVAASHYTLLLVDMSGSVSESEDFARIQEAANVFTSTVESNNLVAIYAFDGSEKITKISDFAKTGEGQDRSAAIAGYTPKDPSTNLNGGVVQALEVLDDALKGAKTPLKFGTLVVFTDGTDRAGRVPADQMYDAVSKTGHDVFAIGLGEEMSEDDLKKLGKTGTVQAENREEVVKAFEDVAERVEGLTKSYYLLSYCSPARAGKHAVTIRANVKNEKGKTKGKGELDSEFDAKGFDTGCDPNTPPKFDVTKGENVK